MADAIKIISWLMADPFGEGGSGSVQLSDDDPGSFWVP
jgi:hypothetical protein